MVLTIANKDILDRWMDERRRMGRDIFSIKGPAPKGATYEDGDPIMQPVNIAWCDGTSGEVFAIEYADSAA